MDKQNYFQYLKSALNLEDILLASPAPTSKTVASSASTPAVIVPQAPIEFLYQDDAALGFFFPYSKEEFNPAQRELFERMMAAIGFDLKNIAAFFNQNPRNPSIACRWRVVMNERASGPKAGEWELSGGLRIFKTFALQSLLDQPELKKQAWEHLKDLAAQLRLPLP